MITTIKPSGGGGGGSTPVASELVQGKAQIATSAQVTTGTEAGAYFVTPLRLQSKIDTALVGGVEYKGGYNNTTALPDLTTAQKGDLYIITNKGAGTLAGVAIEVSDHIVFNQDSANPLTSAYFDVIVSNDAVQSVNGQTGVVTGLLDASNNLSDLAAAGTARTNLGLGTSATINVGTTANLVVQLDGTAKLPAIDGSQLTNLPAAVGALLVANNLSDLNNVGTARTNLSLGTSATVDVGTTANLIVQLDGTAKLPAVDGSQLTNLPVAGGALAAANNLNDVANAGTSRTNLGVAIGSDVQAHDADLDTIAGLSSVDGNFIVGSASGWVVESGGTARTSLGLGTSATTASSDYLAVSNNLSDLNNAGTARTNLGLGTSATVNVGTTANLIVQLDGTAKLPAIDGSQLTNLPGGGGGARPAVNIDSSATITVSAPASSILEIIYLCSATTGTQTVDLHTASGHTGLKYNIKRTGTVNVTIDGSGAETIDGAATFVLSTQYSNLTIVSDGTNWSIL